MHSNQTQYQTLVSDRIGVVNEFEEWHWVTTDRGAFDGPMGDWITSHEDLYKKHVKDWSIVVQAGGNCGMYPSLFSCMFETVYTFEPDPLNFFCLVQNCQNPNIIKMQAALGDVHKMVGIWEKDKRNCGMHQIGAGGKIPQLRIDDLDLPSCGLIQLDIEGYEINALNGALETIEKFHPVISAENANKQVLDLTLKMGYTSKVISAMDTIFIPGT